MFSIQPLCKRSQKGQSNYKFDMMMTIIYCFTCQKINLFYLLTETLNELPVAHVHMFYISQRQDCCSQITMPTTISKIRSLLLYDEITISKYFPSLRHQQRNRKHFSRMESTALLLRSEKRSVSGSQRISKRSMFAQLLAIESINESI
ncbi:hypothetical protein DERP_011268 [Dermatophagoides pteronyssinus]|uniref:Uncharacterized protein n=1 Tax=Dermatophagoides pteronyssinus TaxID=6956 RepID=A0ABQ8J7R6_DERPT|nr:hypothetical protein DERP_011268 [Dermatophagoides pteronyssinus]